MMRRVVSYYVRYVNVHEPVAADSVPLCVCVCVYKGPTAATD